MNFFPKRRAIHPVSQGSMGFALPAVLGSYDFSQPKKEIIVVVGDGSIMMNIQELQTIKHHKINAKIIIINNNIYSIIRRRQNELFRKRTIGTGIEDGVSTPDFNQLSKTFGFKYICSKTSRSLNSSLEKLLSSKSPTILEIYGRHDQAYLEISSTKNSEGKIVKRPLEDQWPFLDRDLFKNEMLIEPIDM
jgi:acetolactate synthase-1/2/3 large subunit